jgi:hypothetical protein
MKSQEKVASNEITYTGGTGGSMEDAIIISGAKKQSDGLDAEYIFISQKYGVRNEGWKLVSQTITQEHGKVFDVLEIELLSNNDKLYYYFDVSSFPWKK